MVTRHPAGSAIFNLQSLICNPKKELDLFPITPTEPFSIRIAADPRLAPTDYGDDGIWELEAEGLLGLRSSFGGRCRTVQLTWNPGNGMAAPLVEILWSSYVKMSTHLNGTVLLTLEYSAASSHELRSRLTLHNHGAAAWSRTLYSSLMVERLDGRLVSPEFSLDTIELEAGPALNLCACWHEADALWGDNPTVAVWHITLAPGESRVLMINLRYGHLNDALAPAITTTDWDEQIAQLYALNAGVPRIETGNPDWDAAIACSYAMSLRCYVGSTQYLPYPSFVFTRIPERGWSKEGNGSDFNWQWNGQVATEAYVSCPIIAQCDPNLAMGIIRNYLAVQSEHGSIDWKPGLAGQREGVECIPLLSAISRIIFDASGDRNFVAEIWPALLRHLRHWFSAANDHDADGLPEWTSTIQSAFDDNPSFVLWQPWAQGFQVQYAEAPDLGAYLYRECCDLLALALEAGLAPADEDLHWLEQRAEHLRAIVESMWCDKHAIYHYRDRDTHHTPTGAMLWEGQSNGTWDIDHAIFAEPGRIVAHVSGPPTDELYLTLHGSDATGEEIEERLEREAFGWWSDNLRYTASATSMRHFARLNQVLVSGLGRRHRLRVCLGNLTRQDQTLLLPLWAGIPDTTRAQALVQTICDPTRFWRPFGIPNCSAEDPAYRSDNRDGSGGTWMMWNTMLGEGLCRYGYEAEAWELFSRIMAAIIGRLRAEHCFREAYDNDTGDGIGDRDYLWGTVPLYLLLLLSGIQILSPAQVRLWHTDLGGRQIIVSRLGVRVTRHAHEATIVWPDGSEQRVELTPGQGTMVITAKR